MKTIRVTRVEIIKAGVGRQFVDMNCEIDEIQLQDDNRTMKIFLKNNNKMKKLKVIKVTSDEIIFENNIKLYSNHEQNCCENHYLDFSDLQLKDFDGLEFNLEDDSFFNKIEDYGIELIPIKGWSVKVPGYGNNNGYYSSNLEIVLSNNKDFNKTFDISECQVITD